MSPHPHSRPPLDRRAWLARAAFAAAALTLPAPLAARNFALPVSRNPDTPDDALAALMAGNRRFVDGVVTEPHRNLARLREIEPKQSPFAAILGCADSRVPVELLFDQGFGDLFVVRNAGNVVTSEEIASLEFGTLVLGARLVMVLGHTGCGAVKATLAGEPVPGQISTLFQHIQPAVDLAHGDVDTAIRENIRLQARLLRESSTVLKGLVKEGKLMVVGGVFDLATGAVTAVAA